LGYIFYDKETFERCNNGGNESNKIVLKFNDNPNMILKSVDEVISLNKLKNSTLFIGKYAEFFNLFRDIYEKRVIQNYNTNNFIMLNGFFNYNNNAIKSTYNYLKNIYMIDLYGYDSELGWSDVLSTNSDNHIFLKYKFFLHLKGIGYLCNSVICAIMAGIPVIMSRENYYKTLYSEFIPEDLIIFIENEDCNKITPNEVEKGIKKAMNMSLQEYNILSAKCFIHGTYFRKYYWDEKKNIINYICKLL